MISAIVLVPDKADDRVRGSREVVARSLVWLVSAVVSGVVREVLIAAPATLDLGDLVDQSGCRLVHGTPEAERLAVAIDAARGAQLLIIKTGFQPEAEFVEELDVCLRRPGPLGPARVLVAPETFLQRLFPDRTATVAILATRPLRGGRNDFDSVAKRYRRAPRFRSCARRII